ncbi:MAG: DUF3047 domain-containing protein [Gammaproteobacteria bacterium]|nr:DUF3047 domain-containing protein [Gammaproteobacteria bacterium]
MNLYTPLSLLLLTATLSSASTNHLDVLKLPDISAWKQEVFSGVTSYELVHIDNQHALKAVSNQSASGLVREMEIDLNQTPYMNWSWKVDSILNNVDETKKSGDDYPARVYVVITDGPFFWQTRALSYAWASKKPQGSSWPNAFTDKATMVAVESGEDLVGEWVEEKRNILEDIKRLLAIDATRIDAVAIMTDTDNSKQSATAYYGNIYFTSE